MTCFLQCGGVVVLYKVREGLTRVDNDAPELIPLQESSDGCGTGCSLRGSYLRDARAPRGA